MSIRAYKVKQIKIEDEPTFNCWKDEEIFKLANSSTFDGGGIIEFDFKEVQKAIQATNPKKTHKLAILKEIEKDAREDGTAQYYCF